MVTIENQWIKIIGERLLDPTNHNQQVDYWRIEKDDSLVVVTQLLPHGSFVLPAPIYRPGVGRATLDFPGGRIPSCRHRDNQDAEQNLDEVAKQIVCRELDIEPEWIQSLTSLQPPHDSSSKEIKEQQQAGGWSINSSFNSQKLFGYVAVLAQETPLHKDHVLRYETADVLLEELDCLQCRHVLLEYLRQKQTS